MLPEAIQASFKLIKQGKHCLLEKQIRFGMH